MDMKKTFLTLFALLACCAAAFGQMQGQDPSIFGVWTSKEISAERANPLLVFEITPVSADSVNLRLVPRSAIFDRGVDKGVDLDALSINLPFKDGKLRFGLAQLRRGSSPKILQVSLHENFMSPAEYVADIERRLNGKLRARCVATTNRFEFEFTPGNPPTLGGDWRWQSMQVQYDYSLQELADMRSRLSFVWSDFPALYPQAKQPKIARD
jgi:hypothetical protein